MTHAILVKNKNVHFREWPRKILLHESGQKWYPWSEQRTFTKGPGNNIIKTLRYILELRNYQNAELKIIKSTPMHLNRR